MRDDPPDVKTALVPSPAMRQVLREHRRSKQAPGAQASLQARLHRKGWMSKVLKRRKAPEKLPRAPRIPRFANYLMGKALNHTLSVGLGSAGIPDSVPKLKLAVALARKAPRRWLAPEPLPPVATALGQKRRLCIEDPATGKSRLAVNYSCRPCKLHVVQDQGATGWDMGVCLFNQWQARGSLEADFVHACMNQVHGACKAAGLHLVAMGVTIVINFTGGPWKNDGHFQELASHALDFFTNGDIESPLLQMYYEHLAQDFGMADDGSLGSLTHMLEVWKKAAQCPYFHKKGRHAQMSRWWAVHDIPVGIIPWVSTLAMVLADCLLPKGVVSCIEDLPLFGGLDRFKARRQYVISIPGGQNLEDSRAAVAHPRAVAESSREVAKLQSQKHFGNQTHLACHILHSPQTWHLMRIMNVINAPTRFWHGCSRQEVATPKGTLNWRIGMAKVGWLTELQGIVATAESEELMAMFPMSMDGIFPEEAAWLQDQQHLVQHACNDMVRLLGWRLLGNLAVGDAFPGKLALLVSPVLQDRATCVSDFKSWSATLDTMELDPSSKMAAYLKDLWWPQWECVQEVLTILAELNWEQACNLG